LAGEYRMTGKAELRRETYDDVQVETRLHANLVQNARNGAADAVQSVVAHWKHGDYAGTPHFSAPTLIYDHFSHAVSKGPVAEAVEHNCNVIAFENLTGFASGCLPPRGSTHGRFDTHSSTSSTEPKWRVSSFEQVSPAYTSRRCSKCVGSLARTTAHLRTDRPCSSA
jgi:hypothetical protein